jgi:hypothetical protein
MCDSSECVKYISIVEYLNACDHSELLLIIIIFSNLASHSAALDNIVKTFIAETTKLGHNKRGLTDFLTRLQGTFAQTVSALKHVSRYFVFLFIFMEGKSGCHAHISSLFHIAYVLKTQFSDF